jgi:hypothetical protein
MVNSQVWRLLLVGELNNVAVSPWNKIPIDHRPNQSHHTQQLSIHKSYSSFIDASAWFADVIVLA